MKVFKKKRIFDSEKISEGNRTFIESATSAIKMAEDVTNMLKDQLENYSRQISKISEMISDGLLLIEENGTIYFSNNSSNDIFGGDITNQNIFDLINFDSISDDKNIIDLSDKISEKDPQPHNILTAIKNGNQIYIDVSMSKVKKSEEGFYFIMIIRDITSQILVENELKEIINNQIDIICCCDINYRITFTNSNFDRNIKLKIDDNLSEFLKDYPNSVLKLKDVNINNPRHRTLYHIDGKYYDWIDTGIFEDNIKIGYQINIRDITDYFSK